MCTGYSFLYEQTGSNKLLGGKIINEKDLAKEIFQEYIRINILPPIERNFDDEVKLFKQAEEFLKEEE